MKDVWFRVSVMCLEWIMKESLNSEGQQFHQYQQHLTSLNTKRGTTTYDVVSVNKLYENPTMCVGLVQSRYHRLIKVTHFRHDIATKYWLQTITNLI